MTPDPSQEPKTYRVIVRLTEAETLAFIKLALALSSTRSRLMRKLIRELINGEPDFLLPDLKTLGQGIFQLGALGRNLNQQLKAIHSGQLTGQAADVKLIKELREQVFVLEEEWLEALTRSKKRWVKP